MRIKVRIVSIFFALSLIPHAHAQFGKTANPQFYSEFKPLVGGWSEYQVRPRNEPPSKMKVAVVGKEGDAYWFEMVIEGQKEGRVVTKSLVSGNPEDKKNVKRIIIKTGNEPAMEMPTQMWGQGSKTEEQQGKVIDKGKETTKVPAGTFQTNHMQHQDGETLTDTWMNKDIAPYGLVKAQSKDFEMVLLGYGTGAKTLILETPQKFEMPQIPQMPQMPQVPPRRK